MNENLAPGELGDFEVDVNVQVDNEDDNRSDTEREILDGIQDGNANSLNVSSGHL